MDGEWIPAWAPIELLCLSPAIVIPRGTTYSDALHVFAGNPGSDHYPQFQVDEIPGTYRLVWRAAFKDLLLPLELRVSNAFRLATP